MSNRGIRTKAITIGVGGLTSSGKTTLVKQLQRCLHNSLIIHQDDFVSPIEKLPINPEYGFSDCEDAPTAVDWDRMAGVLSETRKTGRIPPGYQSLDHPNESGDVYVDEEIIRKWRRWTQKLASIHMERYGERLVWVLVEGFLLYWDARVISNLDARVFLRVPEDVARARREGRTYYTPDGGVWQDPPHYWEKAVWPAYTRAHQHIFKGGDVVDGNLNGEIKSMMLFEPMEMRMEDMVNEIMESVINIPARPLAKN
ncbi:hypothetical protein NP233_g1164 [Leucocoprinus birnbaumii]|uniref:P-loop containing nucleoside triphosphate hydrolase protein n=1 Tax=Leucocoprinus birnbaumii TaxID=56174 RepID=A0AAD5W1K1_9AGAR|nr:hypothetical protein NP233_g1164 [Leucocoprinus birnbaumii]